MLTMENIFSEIIENGGSTPCRKETRLLHDFLKELHSGTKDLEFGVKYHIKASGTKHSGLDVH